MNEDRAFAIELLSDTIDNRLTFFDRVVVDHKRFQSVVKQLFEHIMAPDGKPLMLLIGSSRVGKSTLLKELMRRLIEALSLRPDRGRIPYFYSPCLATGGRFDWRDLYIRLLRSSDAPLIEKIRHLPHKRLTPLKGESRSIMVFFNALETAIRMRRPFVVILDESSHLKRVPVGMTIKDQLDTLKSLAEITNCKILIVGTPELMEFRDLSAQLILRSEDFYFPRYFQGIKADKKDYKEALFTLQNLLPVKEMPNLLSSLDEIMDMTCGSIGLTHDMLLRALRFSLKDNALTITASHIARAVLPKRRRDKYLSEILEFEIETVEDKKERERLEEKLRSAEGDSPEEATAEGKKRKNKPGVRNPSRDRDVVILR